MERPTYFKQVLANLSGLMELAPEKKIYDELQTAMDEICDSYECSLSELPESVTPLIALFRESQSNWFQKQAFIETHAFTLCKGANKVSPSPLNHAEGEEPVENKSFSSTPFVNRMKHMVRIIRRYADPYVGDPLDVIRQEIAKRGVDFTTADHRPADVWIPSSRMRNLCTLSVELEGVNAHP
jgi:hypothetical protein